MSTTNSTLEFVEYRQATATQTMRAVPRFGHSADFALLFSSNEAEQSDYAQGLLFVGCFLLAVFIVWLLVVVALKCMPGAGFLQGQRFTNRTRASRVRVVFAVVALLAITFSVLLVTEGITNLQDTLTTISNSNQQVADVVNGADRIANNLQEVGVQSVTIRNSLVANLGNFCPNTNDLQAITNVDIEGEAQTAIDMLQQLSDFVYGNLQELKDGIAKAQAITQSVDTATTNIAIDDWQSLIILIPFVLIPSFLLVGVFMAACDVSSSLYECILVWFLFPLLIVMTIASISLSSAISIAAVGNADFCSGGSQYNPDESVFSILKEQGYNSSEIVYRAVAYYVDQCTDPSGNPFAFISAYNDQIVLADSQVASLAGSLDIVGVDTLGIICGRDFTDIASLVDLMATNLRILKTSAQDTMNLLQCDRLVPIYTATVYDGTCTYSIQGVTWTFASFLVIAFMGMFMIMFRSAYLADDVSEEDDVKQGHAMGEAVDDYEDDDYDAAHQTYPGTSPRASDDDYSEDDDVYTNTGDDHYDQYEPYEVDYRNRVHHRATAPVASLY